MSVLVIDVGTSGLRSAVVTGQARVLVANTFAPYEIFLMAGLVYLALNYVLTRLFVMAESRLNARVPVIISKRMAPREKRSLR